MKERIDEIRQTHKGFDMFELPKIVSDVVDYLQPQLLPYEAAIYWFMLRHSIVKTEDVFVRVSVRGLGRQVVKSASGQSESLSYGAVQTALAGLEKKEVIQKIGETNREGTPYRLFLPEEIAICQAEMKKATAIELSDVDYHRDGDFYNIPENRIKVYERDSYKCYYCGKQLTQKDATLDHVQPVTDGGDNSYDNLVTACHKCNSRRGARPVMEAIINAER